MLRPACSDPSAKSGGWSSGPATACVASCLPFNQSVIPSSVLILNLIFCGFSDSR